MNQESYLFRHICTYPDVWLDDIPKPEQKIHCLEGSIWFGSVRFGSCAVLESETWDGERLIDGLLDKKHLRRID